MSRREAVIDEDGGNTPLDCTYIPTQQLLPGLGLYLGTTYYLQ